MTSFLLLLLGSTRQGMVFPDPELGCGERSDSVNPLAKKVVQQLRQLQRPWDREPPSPLSYLYLCPWSQPAPAPSLPSSCPQ